MIARSNRERVLQISRWLADKFPTPFPVTVRCPKKIAAIPGSGPLETKIGDYGTIIQHGHKIIINIAIRPGRSRSMIVDALLHEWAHAATIRHANLEKNRLNHDDEWALMYGKIYRSFMDDGGCKESEDY